MIRFQARLMLWGSVLAVCALPGRNVVGQQVTGEAQVWRVLTLTWNGPEAGEKTHPNPFRDYRLMVTFRHGDRSVTIPGYFAADGRAAETGATNGNQWRVHFMPDRPGVWRYTVSFRSGKDIALSLAPKAGRPLFPDGQTGEIKVAPAPAHSRDPRDRGRLQYAGKRYLRYSGNGAYFLKGGADSPENFLAYVDFDNTYRLKSKAKVGDRLHHYSPHQKDWRKGDPTWKGGKGKVIVGALNYLASTGMNSVYFLTMNVAGDGNDVWPWIEPDVRDRFDCSKLDQWNIVFDHMDRLGICLHVVTQETENDQLLDAGELGPTRKLYYRELIARFAHHHGVFWNLGEENTNTTAQIKQFCDFFKKLDPYQNPILVHTFPNQKEKVYKPLLGYPRFDGASLQFSDDWHRIPSVVEYWVKQSARAGRPWIVFVDEPGTAAYGVDPDQKKDGNQDLARKTALWGALMSGGSGVEWYFGYKNPHNDLNCEDWRSRHRMWEQTRHALTFFQNHLPFAEMEPHPELLVHAKNLCLAKPGEVYAIYLPSGGTDSLKLDGFRKKFRVRWFDPRRGGDFSKGSVESVKGGSIVQLGSPPHEPTRDWVVLLKADE
ncbi:MAG: hypothetical protein KatS3mg105_4472 [Gemmatales bacterium]|nr:MAG: hypothetical protein KatS3mg105_4472 [Gemmatales bacterium]